MPTWENQIVDINDITALVAIRVAGRDKYKG